VRSANASLADSLAEVIRGELGSMSDVASAAHSDVLAAADMIGTPLVVPRTAAILVIRGLLDGIYAPETVQAWASFVSAGFIANRSKGPIRPVEIDFEEAWEDAIAAAVSRLDEIGDSVDGEVSAGEALDLLQLLGEP
jgi:hypothetical protein